MVGLPWRFPHQCKQLYFQQIHGDMWLFPSCKYSLLSNLYIYIYIEYIYIHNIYIYMYNNVYIYISAKLHVVYCKAVPPILGRNLAWCHRAIPCQGLQRLQSLQSLQSPVMRHVDAPLGQQRCDKSYSYGHGYSLKLAIFMGLYGILWDYTCYNFGELLVLNGYKWDYTFYKCGDLLVLITSILGHTYMYHFRYSIVIPLYRYTNYSSGTILTITSYHQLCLIYRPYEL